jgi:uncharacterized Tic20 family protein
MSEPLAATIGPEERGLAVITHLSGLAGYILPCAGVLVPIVIWMIKSESRVISSLAKQAIVLNVIVFVLSALLWIPFITVVLIPVAVLGWIVLGLVALILPIVGAVQASEGRYYRYPVVGVSP